MHLKQKGLCGSVLLIYTITTITLNLVGHCEPTVYPPSNDLGESSQPNSHVIDTDLYQENKGRDTKIVIHRSNRRAPPRLSGEEPLGPRSHPRGAAEKAESFHRLENSKRSMSETFGSKPNMRAFLLVDRDGEKRQGETYSPTDPRNKNCSQGDIKNIVRGKFYISGHIKTHITNTGYQSDSAVSARSQRGQVKIRGQLVNSPEESWRRLEPVVDCGEDAMTLTVRRRRAAHLRLEQKNASALLLTQLPSRCGYSVQTTWTDLILRVPYDACNVTHEEGSYVLPLLWRGTPVKMSCPVPQLQPQTLGPSSLCCIPHGMTLTLQGQSATEELRVKVRGEWTPLEALAQQCGYTLDRQAGELLIAVPFITCGITVKDGKYTLSLQIGGKEVTLACPVSPPDEFPQTHKPLVDGPRNPARGPPEPVPENLQPLPWAPPFYLAPPYYPHPTYPHKYPGPDPHEDPSPTPKTTARPQPLLAVPFGSEFQPIYQYYYSYQMPPGQSYKGFNAHSSDETGNSDSYPDPGQNQATSVPPEDYGTTHSPSFATVFPAHVEVPSLQPPSHTFNQYYHYYHHPKIPLPDPPQDLDPGTEAASYARHPEDGKPAPASHNPEFPAFPRYVYQLGVPGNVNSGQIPYPYSYQYLHHLPISSGEVKRLAHSDHATFTTTSLPVHPQTLEAVPSPRPLPILPQPPIHYNFYSFYPYVVQPNPKHPSKSDVQDQSKQINQERIGAPATVTPDDPGKPQLDGSPKWIPDQFLPEDVKRALEDKEGHSAPAVPPLLPPSYFAFYHHPLRSSQSNHQHGPAAITIPPAEQSSSTAPSTDPTPHPLSYYYPPYYHYYHLYYSPEELGYADSRASLSSSKGTSGPPAQTPASPTVEPPQRPDHQFFYPHQLELPYGDLDPTPVLEAVPDNGRPQGAALTAESTRDIHDVPPRPYYYYPSMHRVPQQYSYDAFQLPDGEEAEERTDNEMRDPLEANTYTPSASACGLGPESNHDCSSSLGCCSYSVNECTMGQYFIFAVPDSVVEPTVAPPGQSSEVSDVSCTPQRLTSNLDIYAVPLDGCGVHRHMAGQTEVYLLEVQTSMHEGSPVRLMVECRLLPGTPGTVKFQVLSPSPAPPVQTAPATVTVQLRIATDESFTKYHPEGHLPLSLIRGRPVYVEVGLLNPPEPGLVLLVHYCLAYTYTPEAGWMLAYDGCPGQPQTPPLHTQRLTITSFLSLPTESTSHLNNRGYSHLADPEIYFLCSMEVCSATDGGCTVGCFSRPNGDKQAKN